MMPRLTCGLAILALYKKGNYTSRGGLREMMILWGRNHYPHTHIEETVASCHSALRPNHGAAFSVEVNGEEQLVVAHEINRTDIRKLNAEEVIGAIRLAVGEQIMANVFAVALLKTGSIPKTSSGKIQRRACQKYVSRSQLKYSGTMATVRNSRDGYYRFGGTVFLAIDLAICYWFSVTGNW